MTAYSGKKTGGTEGHIPGMARYNQIERGILLMKRWKERLLEGRKLSKRGFTLVELIIVIVIIAVLAAIAIPSVVQYVNRANAAKALANGKNVFNAASVVAADLYSKGQRDSYQPNQNPGDVLTSSIEEEVRALARVPASGTTITFTIDEGAVDDTTFTYEEGAYTVEFNGDEMVVNGGTGTPPVNPPGGGEGEGGE